MLINFNFKNFKSFAEETFFTMKANTDSSHKENLIPGRLRLSKANVIYGANASGKTSFVEAINFIKMFVVNSNRMMTNQKIPVTPYRFRNNFADVPSCFSLVFIKNEIKYAYEFTCTREAVLSEKLRVYWSAKPTTIFLRTNINEYKFYSADEKLLADIASKNTTNKLFLATADTWNYDKVKPVVDFILNDLFVVSDLSSIWSVFFRIIQENGEMDEYRKFCLDFLNNADLSIDGFDYEAKKLKDIKADIFTEALMGYLEKEDPTASERMKNTEFFNVQIYHKIKHGIKDARYGLDLQEESLGTVNMFEYAPLLYTVFKKHGVLIVDEIDKSLHPLLVRYLFALFLNEDTNSNNAQLIANTHDTNLLDLNFFRRDEIWFTERNIETGITSMFSLADFSPRTNENVERGYLLGRYGAIPFIKGA